MSTSMRAARERCLRTAYHSTTPRLRQMAGLLAALMDAAPEAAQAALAVDHAEFDQYILDQASAAGMDTAKWPAQRKARDAEKAERMQSLDPEGRATRLWDALVGHQAPVAVALAQQLRALPDGWATALAVDYGDYGIEPLRISGDRPPTPETAPWSEDAEDCPACAEVDESICRYHTGLVDGQRAAENGAINNRDERGSAF